jgi:amidohydrolase
MPIVDRIAALQDQMTAWRRDIHAHPELGFAEHRTAGVVAAKLEEFGIEVHRGIGRTGVVGVLRAGSSGRRLGLRADMDALPIAEANTFAHRSTHAGRMHACGHDGHTTMLLGAAKYLAETRNFDGTVHFIFQPAEEGIGGAKAMVEDGLFRRFPCDAIFGMHNRPGMPLGAFAVRAGPMMAGGAFFDIDIEGRGSHGARPESGVDTVLVAAHVTAALQSIVARNVRPVDTAVLSVTQIHGGDAYNVIPQSARLSGTVRAFSNEVMALIGRNMARVAEGVAAAFGARAKTDYRPIFAPLVNDPQEADYAAAICAEIVGADKGACEVHNPSYDFNDRALPYGASFYARLVEKRLAR